MNSDDIIILRNADYDVAPLFPGRWSPRAMSGESIDKSELLTLFEAARWAPSSSNNQPWRFIYAFRGTSHWDRLFPLLSKNNKSWCKNAAALVLIVSNTTFDHNGKFSRTHSFDTGAAWENFALQGSINGLVVHGMQGFDYDRAREVCAIPDGFIVEAMVAVGRPGPVDVLPEALILREKPNTRKPQYMMFFEGVFHE